MAEVATIDQIYRYPFASALSAGGGRAELRLAASAAPVAEPVFFAGALRRPELAASLLLATSEVALRRFYVPPGMLARILRAADPVVTAAGGRLRFESFSQCCGVYARADLLPGMLAADIAGKGTTNVDFNPPMRAALSKVRDADGMDLHVTPQQVAIASACASAVEHKVKLPLRWIKGFAETQTLAAGLSLAITLGGPEARRFLSDLPRQVRAQDRVWLHPSPRGGLRTSQRPGAKGVAVAGLGRLASMKPLARHAQALRIYSSAHGTTAFELNFGEARFLVLLSPAAARGFSGEGQLLAALAAKDTEPAIARLKAELSWQSDLTVTGLAARLGIAEAAIAPALAMLAADGLIGFDPTEQAFFHRVLPFDLARIADRQPRLVAARELHQSGAVSLKSRQDGRADATVTSERVLHRVRLEDGDFHCTCIWHAKTAGDQGPCKHVLAVMLAHEEEQQNGER
jgi:hypothetical protein